MILQPETIAILETRGYRYIPDFHEFCHGDNGTARIATWWENETKRWAVVIEMGYGPRLFANHYHDPVVAIDKAEEWLREKLSHFCFPWLNVKNSLPVNDANVIPEYMIKIATEHGISISRDTENCLPESGACGGDEIWLGNFDNEDHERIAFFHELGHILSGRHLACHSWMTTLTREAVAWEFGIAAAARYGITWEYASPTMEWARKQFRTYLTCDAERDSTIAAVLDHDFVINTIIDKHKNRKWK